MFNRKIINAKICRKNRRIIQTCVQRLPFNFYDLQIRTFALLSSDKRIPGRDPVRDELCPKTASSIKNSGPRTSRVAGEHLSQLAGAYKSLLGNLSTELDA